MASRNWDNLSAAYRKRLERGGINKRQYESGASLEKARGHGKTPEHPGRERKNPNKYREYRDKQRRLIDKIQAIKIDAFSDRIKWNEAHSYKFAKVNPDTGNNRGVMELRELLAYITFWDDNDRPDDWHGLVEIGGVDETETAFYYH